MALTKYKQKRDFKKSPEPQGGKPGKDKLRFVVQKHAASHLHYDFRLEMEGVLKSWAVPKGPSTDPKVKRLAMMVEDHPYDYRNFEGIIPSGYGAGTVMVWDEGFYEPIDYKSRKKIEQDKALLRQLHSGKLHFILKGKKLKGEYILVKAHGRGENGWLLFKANDKYASETDVTKKDRSVISKLTLDGIKKRSDQVWHSNREESTKEKVSKKAAPKKAAVKRSSAKKSAAVKKKSPEKKPGKAARFTLNYKPMLATLVDKPFDEPGWLYEIKWDGYRSLAFVNKGKAELRSRNDKSFNDKFYPLVEELQTWNQNVILDGEVVVVNSQGISDFGALQNWRSEADGDLIFYIFDILWSEGRDLTSLPLEERKRILSETITPTDTIRISENFGESATQFFEVAQKMGLEGIIAKKADSEYHSGARSKEWLKIKANKRQEVVIGGYTRNTDTSKLFSSLLVGFYENDQLVYCGKIGTGFNVATQQEMMKQFKPLIIKTSPFSTEPDVNKPSRFRPNPPNAVATWLKPQLVCEVSFTEMTSDGIMRHPSFEGMRIDKDAKDVTRDKEASAQKIIEKERQKGASKLFGAKPVRQRKTLLNPKEETQVKTINKHELKFTNLGKVFWPKENVTKRDVINYYYQVAPFMLPYLKDRPQSMNRHPNGINGKSFYQKDVTGKAPSWIETYLYHSEADQRDKHFLVATDESSLLYMASLGCIEINPWHSTTQKPDHPDWCIIDLDPDKNSFEQVIEAARVTKDLLDSFGIPSYCKTSGSSGLHIYITFGAKYNYEQSKEFARVIATMVHNELPKFTSIERAVKNRGGKMYIDFLQNRPQATVAAPYSLRPKPGATVSMPLHWDEVKKGLKMTDFTIFNAVDRVRETGDLFKPVLAKGINLEKVIKEHL